MQSAVASIHQLQAISCCKQKSRPAVDTTDGSAGVAGPAGAQRMISWKQMRAVSWKQMRSVSLKQLVRKDVNNSGVESAVEEVNGPDVVVQLLTYQMLINRGESAVGTTNSKTVDKIYEENQQLMSDTKKSNS
ncbi:hypothetical protein F511_25925 [Dorcoceras hygrometricum]|uniref:Uncharacterized protein n=1 Tax=Dorcoceras hygrometricum TaxID=472368 RepID=A0A2Z7D2H8_9LAMI|nr:hypothetical protein F511_25925 [Dorcoceras hygrometricum]